jgi:tetratricopeptide (TPR) repeat protein
MKVHTGFHEDGRNVMQWATIGQQSLFRQPEIIKNKAAKALVNLEFIQAEKLLQKLKTLEPDNGFVGPALEVCRFWNDLYPDSELLSLEDSLEVYRHWREFETYLNHKEYEKSTIIKQIKRNIFLKRIGLERRSTALRESLELRGIESLDLLMEIEEWELAVEEIKEILMKNPSYGDGAFFLKCSKVYYRIESIPTSRRFLLRAFWHVPDLIMLGDILDTELLKELESIYPDYKNREESVELIPYVGLMGQIFPLPPKDSFDYTWNLRKMAKRYETNNEWVEKVRIRYRLFSLYAWESEVAKLIGENYVDARSKMKELNSQLFSHYMERIKHPNG